MYSISRHAICFSDADSPKQDSTARQRKAIESLFETLYNSSLQDLMLGDPEDLGCIQTASEAHVLIFQSRPLKPPNDLPVMGKHYRSKIIYISRDGHPWANTRSAGCREEKGSRFGISHSRLEVGWIVGQGQLNE